MNAITPTKLLVQSGLDWNATKVNTYFRAPDGEERPTGKHALIRSTDYAVLSPNVGKDWQPVQNATALHFFDQFCQAGEMQMESAGQLKNGQFVYAFARINEGFELPGQDVVQPYMLFCNPHRVGHSVNILFTPRRLFCDNQLPMMLSEASTRFRCIHTAQFDPEEAKLAMGLSRDMFKKFETTARFLASRRFTQEKLESYFAQLFPGTAANDDSAATGSRRALLCIANLESQPGAQASEGSWWQAFNTVTYVADHVLGRNEDNRRANAWFGWSRQRKQDALELAVKMADAA